jgi:hypothetical protein
MKGSSSALGPSRSVALSASYSSLKTSPAKVSGYIRSSGSSSDGFQYSLNEVVRNFSAAGSVNALLRISRGRRYQILSTTNRGASASERNLHPSHGTGIDTLPLIHPPSGLNGKESELADDVDGWFIDVDGWFLSNRSASRAVENVGLKSDALKSSCRMTSWISLSTSA